MTDVGCRTPPISQLTVRAFPFITNRALFAGVTIYWPNRPVNLVEKYALCKYISFLHNYLPEDRIGRIGLLHCMSDDDIAGPTPVIISTLPEIQ